MTQSTKLLSSLIAIALRQIGAELDPNLPWDNLTGRLSANATLLQSTSNQDYVDECYPEFRDKSQLERSVTNLESQPSGLCIHPFSCAFENCLPFEIGIPFQPEWLDPSNPLFNVPSSVVFPAVAGDVVAVVEFARDNGVELSVKNSGHNQAGASGKKDTLLVNTQRYADYASTGIVECSDNDGSLVNQDLSNQACLLALARDKNAFIRVGGGENFGDVFESVKTFNEAQDSYKYHAVGGAIGTVTPMGWTFQGGLGGTTAGRLYGFGLDQVLQIEAVLPNGQHVRFGPTSWEDADGFVYPKTTAVSGVCNTNPGDDEASWIWKPCPTEINFDDLWFAFRGGGGGTWGIVTSIYLQLHDYLPLEVVNPPNPIFTPSRCNVTAEEVPQAIVDLGLRFEYDYMLDPSSLGISEAESAACGAPDFPLVHCYGEGMGEKFSSTWKVYLQDRKQELIVSNVTEESIDRLIALGCFDADTTAKDVLDTGIPQSGLPPPGLFNWGDQNSNGDIINSLVPLSFYQNQKEMFYEFFEKGTTSPYMAHTGKANDQTTSLSPSHYSAGFQLYMSLADAASLLETAYGVNSKDTTIPGHIGGNHFLTSMYGPLKSDPTKPCDAQSAEEADEKCFPTQAGVWGENLARLEAIKKEIDPSGIFNCNKCVGNNLVKSVAAPVSTIVEQSPAPVAAAPVSAVVEESPAPVAAAPVSAVVEESPAPVVADVAAPVSAVVEESPAPVGAQLNFVVPMFIFVISFTVL